MLALVAMAVASDAAAGFGPPDLDWWDRFLRGNARDRLQLYLILVDVTLETCPEDVDLDQERGPPLLRDWDLFEVKGPVRYVPVPQLQWAGQRRSWRTVIQTGVFPAYPPDGLNQTLWDAALAQWTSHLLHRYLTGDLPVDPTVGRLTEEYRRTLTQGANALGTLSGALIRSSDPSVNEDFDRSDAIWEAMAHASRTARERSARSVALMRQDVSLDYRPSVLLELGACHQNGCIPERLGWWTTDPLRRHEMDEILALSLAQSVLHVLRVSAL